MKEIKWINAAEQKPAEDQKVLVLSKGISGSKEQKVCENLCVFKDGKFICDTGITVTRGDEFEEMASVSWKLVIENVFAWTDLAAIYVLCEQLKEMIKEEDAK